ncbi:hypothetical protein G4D82_06545 [Flavobacterium sp. CYK-4]|uniref:hypothetical protein n=1 Tax=Flavobacterium lotistagni TaxID=2709660 RepID=UPI00140D7519|nr:hypothetical protein [Flavobacterium lotistagni]NHM06873.1 hypothetical protein [Flavobacterium lotistagni]
MMFLTSSILLGFIRLCVILLFLFYLNRKFVNVSNHVHFLDFIIMNWFRYIGVMVVVIFALVESDAYNLFNCFFIFTILFGIDIIGIDNLKNPKHFFRTRIREGLLTFLRNIENKKSFWFWFSLDKNYQRKKNNVFILILTVLIGAITFLSRYYFIIYDNYSLSDAWIYDLNKVIQFDNQYWFTYELATDAELAIVNFYGKITDVSPEIALQVIAILESTLLAVIIFWIINKLTPSKFIAPTIAALFFSLVYVLTPLNVYFLLKGNPTFMALTFALPAFAFYIKPTLLKLSRTRFFFSFLFIFITIGLTDLFTYCILIPPFLIIALMFTKMKFKRHNFFTLAAYLTATILLYAIYSYACYYQRADLLEYMQNNLLSVSSYTYVPQLILPYSEIIRYAQYTTGIGFILTLLLVIIRKENWRATIIFFVYFNFLILLTFIKSEWLDIDMLNNSISVFLPIMIGLNLAIVMRILNFGLYRWKRFSPVTVAAIFVVMIYASFFYQQKNINALTVSDQTPKHILNAYDKISQTFFKHSYCVVNDPAAQVISNNSHFFMNYDFFLNDYPKIDSINTKHLKEPNFLVKNPQYSISKSVLVFVLNNNAVEESNIFAANKQLQQQLINNIKLLEKRGRKVNLFYNTDILKVYEIVNAPGESKLSDLIF